jgi:hypothetical protein
MSKFKVGETVEDGSFTWNTSYNSDTDRFEYRWHDGNGNSGVWTDYAGLNWPFKGPQSASE